MVFQQFNLFGHMSVLDNVTLAPRRLSPGSRRCRAPREPGPDGTSRGGEAERVSSRGSAAAPQGEPRQARRGEPRGPPTATPMAG